MKRMHENVTFAENRGVANSQPLKKSIALKNGMPTQGYYPVRVSWI